MTDDVDEAPPPAVRLTFAYDASGVRLLSRTPVSKPAPPSERLEGPPAAAHVSVELRTSDDTPTYRQGLPAAIPATVEVPGGARGLKRVPNEMTEGAFATVVPADDAAVDVVLIGQAAGLPEALAPLADGPPVAGAPAGGPVELGRFRLRDEP